MSFGKGGGQKEPAWKQFLVGGLSGCGAAICTHPADLIKVRMQISGMGAARGTNLEEGIIRTGVKVFTNEGVLALYNGLSASLLRQATYTTVRIGLYLQLKEYFSKPGENPSIWKKMFIGMAAGAGGAAVGSPADVVMVRMQADGNLPFEQRRNYKHAIDGLSKIVKAEGIPRLWTGSSPNIARAMLMSAGQLASYDQAKESLLKTSFFKKDNLTTHFTASLIAGFVAAFVTNPVDTVKTRIMNQKNGELMYKNSMDCAIKIFNTEGPLGFYKGFLPYFLRLGPTTILTFIFYEQISKLLDFSKKGRS